MSSVFGSTTRYRCDNMVTIIDYDENGDEIYKVIDKNSDTYKELVSVLGEETVTITTLDGDDDISSLHYNKNDEAELLKVVNSGKRLVLKGGEYLSENLSKDAIFIYIDKTTKKIICNIPLPLPKLTDLQQELMNNLKRYFTTCLDKSLLY